MAKELGNNPELETEIFFDRPVHDVAFAMGEEVQFADKSTVPSMSEGMILWVPTQEGLVAYRIKTVEPYKEADANQLWKKTRAGEIRAMKKGGVIAYPARVGRLSFTKTQGADNILIRRLVNVTTGEIAPNATAVTRILGLGAGEKGQLTVVNEKELSFLKVPFFSQNQPS